MARTDWRGDPAQWRLARAAWEATGSFRAAERAAGGNLSRTQIGARARAEAWERDGAGGTAQSAAETTPEARERVERAAVSVAERKLRLAERLLDSAERLQQRISSPVTLKEAKVVPLGGMMGSEVRLVEIDLPESTPADAQRLMTAIAIAVDKVQLITGEATARTETGPAPARAEAEARVRELRDELAARRGERDAARLAGGDGEEGAAP